MCSEQSEQCSDIGSVTFSFTGCSRAVPVPGPSAKLLPAVESNLCPTGSKGWLFLNFGISNYTNSEQRLDMSLNLCPVLVSIVLSGHRWKDKCLAYDALLCARLLHAVSSFGCSTPSSMFFIPSSHLTTILIDSLQSPLPIYVQCRDSDFLAPLLSLGQSS